MQETGTAGWQETFGYDQWGNRWVNTAQTSGIVLSPNTPTALSWFTGKNRLNLTNSFDRAASQ